MGVESEQLVEVLAKGKVPRIVVSDSLELTVVGGEENETVPFVALSHVCITSHAPPPPPPLTLDAADPRGERGRRARESIS